MKKIFGIILLFFIASGAVFTQTAESPVPQMDEAVKTLAGNIHAKLAEVKAEKISIGQFSFLDGLPQFSVYWVNQLTNELTNMRGRNYLILSGGGSDADWTINGEIVQAADIIRVYSRMIRSSDRAIEAGFYSSFRRNEHINEMIAFSSSGSSGESRSSAGRDSREPDSWENPVQFAIGTSASAAVMNRTITDDDEDFFLLIPERDGRLTAETTGGIDTMMTLYNYENEDELASNDDGGQNSNARISYNVRAGVGYLAVVSGYSSSASGSYGFRAYLTVREGSSNWGNPVAYEIGIGEENAAVMNRTIQRGDADYFLLVPEREGRLTMETTGRMDTIMELYEAGSEELLEENDDGGNNSNARIRYNVREGVSYIAVVRGYGDSSSGNYGFRAYFAGSPALTQDEFEPDNEPVQAVMLEIDETQRHSFHTKDDVDWIKFNIINAGRYIINVRGEKSNRLDTYIELYDSGNNTIAEDDDGGDSLSSRLSLNLSQGLYRLKILCLDEEPDQAYTVKITAE